MTENSEETKKQRCDTRSAYQIGNVIGATTGSVLTDEVRDELDAHIIPVRAIAGGRTNRDGCQIASLVRVAGNERDHDTPSLQPPAKPIDLFQEVIHADRRMLDVLTAGATIDLYPVHITSFRRGSITIDCAFRLAETTGQLSALRPTSQALCMAVSLLVLSQLLGCRETIRQPLARQSNTNGYCVTSATLRAGLIRQGPQRPDALITWLRDRGHAALAADVEHETGIA